MLGTDDEQHYWDCHDAAAEIERLRRYRDMAEADREVAMLAAERFRLTDGERDAILAAADLLIGSKPGVILRNLLERMK
jgi:hypothetical protein